MRFELPVQVFCSYAHEDQKFLEKFRKQVRPLELLIPPYVCEWDDRKIRGGMDWTKFIHTSVHRAQLFIFLISDDFLNSGYCLGTELQLATQKYEREEAAIVPIIVRDCFWEVPQLARFQVLPENGEPAGRKDKAWKQVVTGLKASIEALSRGAFFPAKGDLSDTCAPDLPYLCGQKSQENAFAAALKAAPRHRPFICILTGAGDQAHTHCIDRLIAGSAEMLDIPPDCAIHDPEPAIAWRQIADPTDFATELAAILNNPTPSKPEVNEIAIAVAPHPGLTVIRSTWVTNDWRDNTGRLLAGFLRFWELWPDLKTHQYVIVFLAVKYLNTCQQPANASMATEIAKISPSPSLLKLELTPITGREITDWLNNDPQINENYDKTAILARLNAIVKDDQEISMEEAARLLRKLLAENRTGER